MPRRALVALLLAIVLVSACSGTPATPGPATATAVAYGPALTTATPAVRATSSPGRTPTRPGQPTGVLTPAPSPTPTAPLRLDRDAERARQYVLSLADLPPGFSPDRARVVTNEHAAAEEPDPGEVLADYARWGRVTGFEAAYSRGGAASLVGLAGVESVASVYRDAEGAHASFEDFLSRAAADAAAPVSMPTLGDESAAVRMERVSGQGSVRTLWVIFAVRIRVGEVLISVNAYGTSAMAFEDVLALARSTLARPRVALPAPLPTPTPGPTLTPEPSVAPTAAPGKPAMVLMSSRAYRPYPNGPVFVVGEAENRGTAPAARVQVAVSLLDAGGAVLAAANVNAAHVAVVPAGGRYPIRVMLDRVPREWSDVRIQIQGLSAEGEPARHRELSVTGETLIRPSASADGYGLAGDVVNNGQSAARGVRIVAVAYDGQGLVRDVAVTTAKLESIEPGGRAPFALVWIGVLTDPPYRWALYLEGQSG